MTLCFFISFSSPFEADIFGSPSSSHSISVSFLIIIILYLDYCVGVEGFAETLKPKTVPYLEVVAEYLDHNSIASSITTI